MANSPFLSLSTAPANLFHCLQNANIESLIKSVIKNKIGKRLTTATEFIQAHTVAVMVNTTC